VTVVLEESLPRVPAAADDVALTGVAVVVPEHRHDAGRRAQLAEPRPLHR